MTSDFGKTIAACFQGLVPVSLKFSGNKGDVMHLRGKSFKPILYVDSLIIPDRIRIYAVELDDFLAKVIVALKTILKLSQSGKPNLSTDPGFH